MTATKSAISRKIFHSQKKKLLSGHHSFEVSSALPSYRPGFESQAFLICIIEIVIEAGMRKEARIGPYLKKKFLKIFSEILCNSCNGKSPTQRQQKNLVSSFQTSLFSLSLSSEVCMG